MPRRSKLSAGWKTRKPTSDLLLVIGGSALASVERATLAVDPRPSGAQLSVIGLNDEQVFERRDPEKGSVVHEAESRLNLEAGGNSAMGNVGTSVLVSRLRAPIGGTGTASP